MEKEKRYIIYLEPGKGNKLRGKIEEYFERSKKLVGINEAQQYMPHCSVTGFFVIREPAGKRDEILSRVIEIINRQLNHHQSQLEVKALNVSLGDAHKSCTVDAISPAKSVKISLSTRGLIEMAKVVQAELSLLGVDIRTKPVDHISLAYISNFPLIKKIDSDNFYFGSYLGNTLECRNSPVAFYNPHEYYHLAKEMMSGELREQRPNVNWDLALYEEDHSKNMFVPHEFKELKRWHLNNYIRIGYPDR